MQKHCRPGVGLVLSGGGGKGAYKIGVWQALDEFGATGNIKGTPVGALNAALFAQGDLSRALQVWKKTHPLLQKERVAF